ncbi:MAG: hydroxymethylbilane synthase [Bacteroidetes bacterium]|jgi:hydroxymethylbilane synthase|nr:MAG: hydroxymethylbilane synthase [Bacteroidota bacterium]
MKRSIRIGTRDSALALWQANKVAKLLEKYNQSNVLHPVKSEGDLNLVQPIYQMGISGVFTRGLDAALLRGEIDIAVHSMKDVPTALAEGLEIVAVLKRGATEDVIVKSPSSGETLVATGSLRRKAQWLRHNPNHSIIGLRGNVQTRLNKVYTNPWLGGIFALAGLERLEIKDLEVEVLDWMLPAPAQGAIVVVAKSDRNDLIEALALINHTNTALEVQLEREFLRQLEGGCSSPIGAIAKVNGEEVVFKGGLFSLDGSKAVTIEKLTSRSNAVSDVALWVDEVLKSGGEEILKELRDGKDS